MTLYIIISMMYPWALCSPPADSSLFCFLFANELMDDAYRIIQLVIDLIIIEILPNSFSVLLHNNSP